MGWNGPPASPSGQAFAADSSRPRRLFVTLDLRTLPPALRIHKVAKIFGQQHFAESRTTLISSIFSSNSSIRRRASAPRVCATVLVAGLAAALAPGGLTAQTASPFQGSVATGEVS